MKKVLAIFVLLLLAACSQQNHQTLDANIKAEIKQFINQPIPSPNGKTSREKPLPIAYFVETDEGLLEYSLLNEDLSPKSLEEVSAKPVKGLNGMSEVLAGVLQQENEAREKVQQITPQSTPTDCSFLSLILKSGCHYLVETNETYSFNAIWMQVKLPSRSNGYILVEETSETGCSRNRDNLKGEVPYIILGGHSQGSLTAQQNIDSGLQWNCDKDNWSLFVNTANPSSGGQYAISPSVVANQPMRLVSNQAVLLTFFVNNDNYPMIYARGKWVSWDGTKTINDGWVFYKCNTTRCNGKNWAYSGYDTTMRLEVNLAQKPSSNFKSGAVFANTIINGLYVGNYNRSSNTWTKSYKWNVSGSKSSSSYTNVQCIIPSTTGYSLFGTANSTTTPLNVSLRLPKF